MSVQAMKCEPVLLQRRHYGFFAQAQRSYLARAGGASALILNQSQLNY